MHRKGNSAWNAEPIMCIKCYSLFWGDFNGKMSPYLTIKDC